MIIIWNAGAFDQPYQGFGFSVFNWSGVEGVTVVSPILHAHHPLLPYVPTIPVRRVGSRKC